MKHILVLFISLLVAACDNSVRPPPSVSLRSYVTSFESESDFNGFYIFPPGEYDSYHEKSSQNVHHGQYAHKAWILKARDDSNDSAVYLPHRAYPTIQFHKTADGVFKTPCLVSLWVHLEMDLVDQPAGHIDDWFSFVTLSPDSTDNWSRTVLVNLTPDGYIKLVHVPLQGQQDRLFQADAANDPDGQLLFPQKTWVRLDIFMDFDPVTGSVKAWQNGKLISHANVKGGYGYLAQAHFGLYASAAVPSGTIYNDKLRILEVRDEPEAVKAVYADW